MTEFQQKIVNAVKLIPRGKVVSYGQVALYIGMPRGAQAVGWALRVMPPDSLAWWRVINNQGRISIKGNTFVDANNQKELLEAEGIKVLDNLEVNIEAYRFQLPLS